ncbi:hypothetical protein H0R92_07345 [Treponema sp. OMZ 840]|uniref:hypothetical protein n=1 Tax=Treponema sp. OMZ 840 TaxID=244313 RepID=UPI003D8DA0B6
MKKLSAVVVFCLITVISAFALTRADHIESGEYAYYLDRRDGMNFLRGYFALRTKEGLTVISRNIDLTTNKEMNYYFTVSEPKEGSCELTGMTGIDENAPPEIAQSYIDFFSYISMYTFFEPKFTDSGIGKVKEENKTLLFALNKVLPFFRFSEMFIKEDKKTYYMLVKGGKLTDSTLDDFFTAPIFPPDEVTRPGADLSIPKKKKGMYKVNGLAVRLDENWEYNENFGHPGYWLNIHGRERDAQIMIEKEDVSILKDSDNLTDLARTSLEVCPAADYLSVEFRHIKGNVELSYFLYDESGYKNYQYCFICTKGKDLYVVNFSAFADIFEANKAYFDKIISQVLEDNDLRR